MTAAQQGVALTDWLIEEPADPQAVARSVILESALAERGPGTVVPTLSVALRLHDVVIHDNKRWFNLFGGADVRLDAVVVQGNVIEADPTAAYVPTTMRFAGIGDGDHLPSDDFGMLLYYGYPRHFLDISIIVSRDRQDTDDLAAALAKEMNSSAMKSATVSLLGLAVAAPPAAAVAGAITAATTIGDLAYQVVRAMSGTTIGMYRGCRLAHPDKFGSGRNPSDGSSYRNGDLSFWYEVITGPDN
jgi:hypothetical protein